ncbi:LPS export ABC transporter permease LptF [Dongia soli]|uniref:LPS export ABC transporter permease LptF n=1 Tax=Dongia soli TaxID=600628 RepID=A0ABU5ECI6_9PROT|nr:LPS export ABC transporter permease LptF [Dongia soli]MDY0883143.1 LPS export ABC transporter permease LptF [Dongia soli]
MRLIDLYILKRVSWPLIASMLIALSGLLMERLIRLLDLFANRGGPLTLIMKMLAYLVPHYLAVAIPAAFFVGILYASLRLSSDSELDALRATGLSLGRILAPIASLACVLTVICVIIIGFLQPYTRYAYRALVYLVTETSWNSAIERGAFFSGFGGKTILIGDIADGGHKLSQIFIKEADEGNGTNKTHTVITAPTGDLTNDPFDFSVVLKMYDGYRVELNADGSTARSIKFQELQLPLEAVSPQPFRQRGDRESEMTFFELIQNWWLNNPHIDASDLSAEVNYRLVRSISVLFLPFLALPLGLSSRRSPKNFRLVAGIIFLICYYQVLEFGNNLVQHGKLSALVALWLPFLVFAIPSTWLFYAANKRVGQDPLAMLFEALGEASRFVSTRFRHIFRRGARSDA